MWHLAESRQSGLSRLVYRRYWVCRSTHQLLRRPSRRLLLWEGRDEREVLGVSSLGKHLGGCYRKLGRTVPIEPWNRWEPQAQMHRGPLTTRWKLAVSLTPSGVHQPLSHNSQTTS